MHESEFPISFKKSSWSDCIEDDSANDSESEDENFQPLQLNPVYRSWHNLVTNLPNHGNPHDPEPPNQNKRTRIEPDLMQEELQQQQLDQEEEHRDRSESLTPLPDGQRFYTTPPRDPTPQRRSPSPPLAIRRERRGPKPRSFFHDEFARLYLNDNTALAVDTLDVLEERADTLDPRVPGYPKRHGRTRTTD